MVIRETESMQVAYTFRGDSEVLLMSNEILLFKGKNSSDVNKLGLINFVHNKQFRRVKT
jgi:hypothetical protein